MLDAQRQDEFFQLVGSHLAGPVTCWALGGTAMVYWGLKPETKDVDLITDDPGARADFMAALSDLGFEKVGDVSDPSKPVAATRGELSVDVFCLETTHMVLSAEMKARTGRYLSFGRLNLGLPAPQDILVLKSATDRREDVLIGGRIIRRFPVDWSVVLAEAVTQERLGKSRVAYDLFDFLWRVSTETGAEVPAFVPEELRRQVLETLSRPYPGEPALAPAAGRAALSAAPSVPGPGHRRGQP